jgi:hypothetical protein
MQTIIAIPNITTKSTDGRIFDTSENIVRMFSAEDYVSYLVVRTYSIKLLGIAPDTANTVRQPIVVFVSMLYSILWLE